MNTPEVNLVNKMFTAFKTKDLEVALSTVSKDSIWVHHGTQKIQSIRFEGKSGVSKFFETNFSTMNFKEFNYHKIIQYGDTVVVFGEEEFLMQGDPQPFKQKWVQIYTIKDNLISKMEEFATSTLANDYLIVT